MRRDTTGATMGSTRTARCGRLGITAAGSTAAPRPAAAMAISVWACVHSYLGLSTMPSRSAASSSSMRSAVVLLCSSSGSRARSASAMCSCAAGHSLLDTIAKACSTRMGVKSSAEAGSSGPMPKSTSARSTQA